MTRYVKHNVENEAEFTVTCSFKSDNRHVKRFKFFYSYSELNFKELQCCFQFQARFGQMANQGTCIFLTTALMENVVVI